MDGSVAQVAVEPPPSAAEPLLRVRGLAVSPAPERPVLLDRVSLDLAAGECVAMVGPSGAGKTSLLRTIACQIPPRGGRFVLDGVDPAGLKGDRLRAFRRQIGFVAQKHDLVDTLHVHRNVMAGALGRWSNLQALRYLFWTKPHELSEAETALEAVGLKDKLREPTAALSGGQQQRVAIARTLVQAPALLLADEPVASLDPATAHEVLGLLTGLARSRGMALICSLHQPELAARYFDRTLSVDGGRVKDVTS